MKFDDNDQKLIHKLKNLPNIEDPTSKEEIYQRVSSNMSRKSMKKGSFSMRGKLIPIFSTALVVTIILILVPSLINTEKPTTQNPNELASSGEEHNQENNDSNDSNEENMTNEMSEKKTQTTDDFTSYVLQSKNKDDLIVYGAFPDDQFQYAIPVSFIVSNTTTDLNDYYNKISDLLNEKLDFDMDLLDGITFDIEEETQGVVAHLGEQFSLDEGGTARAAMFSDVLSLMFTPYGIDKITFSADGTQNVDLGPIGQVSELELYPIANASYKLYHEDKADSSSFLIPVVQDESSSITDALDEMKTGEDHYHLTATVPDQVEYRVEDRGNELVIAFSEQTNLEQSQQVMTMIEAMLLTAKSYDYDVVQFTNTTVEQIGNYSLDEPIEVPEAVNPID